MRPIVTAPTDNILQLTRIGSDPYSDHIATEVVRLDCDWWPFQSVQHHQHQRKKKDQTFLYNPRLFENALEKEGTVKLQPLLLIEMEGRLLYAEGRDNYNLSEE